MIGAAKLRTETYEEVEADRSATLQAVLVVVIVALATGIGFITAGGVSGLIRGVVSGLAGWVLWAWITYFVGTKLFRTPDTQADWGQLARTLGFAQSPGVLRVFGVVPVVGPVLFVLATLWQLVAMVIAVRQALDYTSTWRAIRVVVTGFIPYVVLTAIVSAPCSGKTAPAFFRFLFVVSPICKPSGECSTVHLVPTIYVRHRTG
jgi:hypothetical protein